MISNIRLGFANNSSSSHSILFSDNISDANVPADGGFGWGDFVLSSKEAKTKYLMAILMSNINDLPLWLSIAIVKDQLGYCPDNIGDYYVDHESLWVLPLDYNGKYIDIDFFNQLKKFVLDSNMVIYGGNDNDDSNIFTNTHNNLVITDLNYGEWRCRYDPEVKYWSLFNSVNGSKIRFKFDNTTMVENNGTTEEKIRFSSLPELVDINITNYCDKNCYFCYQNSGIKGKHAKHEHIVQLSYILNNLKVWEVALGGGEPTEHPDFISILEHFKSNKIAVNFTTKSLSWLDDERIVEAVKKNCSSFAFSISDYYPTLIDIYNKIISKKLNNFSFQIIPGIVHSDHMGRIYEFCRILNIPLTLLGLKYCGKGYKCESINLSWIMPRLKELRDKYGHVTISVDEQFIKQHYEEITKDSEIPKILYEHPGNKFSCYIDAVNLTMARTSYSEDKISVANKGTVFTTFNSDLIKKVYKSF